MRERPLLNINRWLILLAFSLTGIQIYLGIISPQYATQELYSEVGLGIEGLKHGRLWTFLTYAFFHHPFLWHHLVFNILALLYLGGRISHILSPQKSFTILTLSILGGGVGELLSSFVSSENYPLIGISGGISGLFSTLVTLSPETKFWPLPIRGENILKAYVIGSVILTFIPLSWLPEGIPKVGHGCHLGGILVGVLYTKKLLRIPSLKHLP